MNRTIKRGRNQFQFALLPVLLFLILFVASIPAQGQSRVDDIKKQQAEKAQHLAPYVPTKAEGIIIKIQGLGLLTAPRCLYPFIGSAFPAGGFAGGPGYRMMYGDNGIWDIHGAWSVKNYIMADTTLKLPDLANGQIESRINAHYADAGQVAFFGVGNDTSDEDETDYAYIPISATLTETYSPVRWFTLGGAVEYLDARTGP